MRPGPGRLRSRPVLRRRSGGWFGSTCHRSAAARCLLDHEKHDPLKRRDRNVVVVGSHEGDRSATISLGSITWRSWASGTRLRPACGRGGRTSRRTAGRLHALPDDRGRAAPMGSGSCWTEVATPGDPRWALALLEGRIDDATGAHREGQPSRGGWFNPDVSGGLQRNASFGSHQRSVSGTFATVARAAGACG